MSFLVYQRSDPRYKDWLLLLSQQVRLRNVIQVIGLNLEIENRDDEVYFTLHTRAMATPFFTSERIQSKRRVVTWKEIEPRQIPEEVRLSAPGFIIRIWLAPRVPEVESTGPHKNLNQQQQQPVTSWGVYLGGLFFLGSKGDWNTKDFGPNTLLFRMPFGFFTSLDSLVKRPISAHRYRQIQVPNDLIRSSYTLKKLSTLHSIQRSVLEEVAHGHKLKTRICLYGFSQDVHPESHSSNSSNIFSEKMLLRAKEGKMRLELKEKIESMRQRVSILRDEKTRRFGRVIQLKKDFYDCEDISMDLMGRMQMLGRDMERLKELKATVQEKKVKLAQLSVQTFQRKRELISELLLIYPLSLVEGSKKYSINEIQLPNAEDYGTETGGQISVALGYTAHLTAMMSFFLGIPLRYPVRHFGSLSRIVDHITEAITDKEREFPLYFRSKEDVYSKYAVYLLNKNIAQLRWFCGLSTPELRATLPNLHELLHDRLIIPGWPPSPAESLEVAQELTEEVDQQLFSSVSLDKGLDQLLPSENGLENTWLRNSVSDLGCAGGNNAVPSGEVKHGKAQDRFLNGWRKKTYESEEIDPRWLTNSLNLDFDAGRRLSNSSIGPFRTPLVLVSDESKAIRRRRVGRVEQFLFSRRGSVSSKGMSPEPPSITITSTATEPNDNLNHIENEITKLERRKSLAGESSVGTTPRRGSPSEDFQLSFTLPMANEELEISGEEHDEVHKDIFSEPHNQITSDSTHTQVEEADECGGIHFNRLLHLQPNYDHSNDGRVGISSPKFKRKLSMRLDDMGAPIIASTPTQNLVPEPIPSQSDAGINPLNLPVDNQPDVESSYRIMMPVGSDLSEGPLLRSTESSTGSTGSEKTLELGGAGDEGDFGTSGFEDELWLRTAALLNPQSFNVIKRRISESN